MEPRATSLAEVLGGVGPFRDLAADDLRRLEGLFEQIELPALERVLQPLDAPARYFFVVCAGSVSVYRDEVGRPVQLQGRVNAGGYFGEQGLFGDAEGVSALAREDCTLARVRHDRLLPFFDDHPEVALKLQMAAARRHTENVAAALDSSGRSDPRIRVGHDVVLELPFDRRSAATLENLSVGGLCLDGIPDSWREGMRMAFRLRVAGEVMPVDARVSWRQGSLAGLAFAEPDEAHERRVRRILRTLRDEMEGEAPG